MLLYITVSIMSCVTAEAKAQQKEKKVQSRLISPGVWLEECTVKIMAGEGEREMMMDFQEQGDGSGPGSLETDRGTQVTGDNVDSVEMASSIQCSDQDTAVQIGRSTDTNVSPVVSLFNNRLPLFGRYNENGDYLGGGGFMNSEIGEKLRQQFNGMRQYEVKEPVGCAILIGCKGPETKPLSDAVFRDVQLMNEALEKTGQWRVTCVIDRKLPRMKLLQKINDMQLEELKKYSMFLLYFSGHGNCKGVLLTDSNTVKYKEIVRKVAAMEQLEGKPKVFIFDTCRIQADPKKVRKKLNRENFPPRDTILCFSTVKYCSSMLTNRNSFYTLALAHSIGTFGEKYSFQEIVTYASYITQEISSIMQDFPRAASEQGSNSAGNYSTEKQLPMFLSSLDRLLILSANRTYESTGMDPSPVEEATPLGGITAEGVFKGVSQDIRYGEVEKDIVHLRDVEVKSEWKTKEQVMENMSTLGEGISVFVIYAPNPEDPCQALPSNAAVLRNKVLMLRLIFDLEHHGFHVLSDIHLGDTEPTNWLKWYVSRILQCNFVLMVCSPAFKEVFQETSLAGKIVDDKTKRLMEYSNAIYSELEKSTNRSKFLPVILDIYSKEEAVPVLFQPGTVFRIGHEDNPRRFNYDNTSRDFEKLVCVLAGIDRNRLDQPKLGEVKLLKNPYEIRDMELEMKKRQAMKLQQRSLGLPTNEELRSPSNLAGGGGGVGGWCSESQPKVLPGQPSIGLAQPVHHWQDTQQPHQHHQQHQPVYHQQAQQQPHPYYQHGQQPHPYDGQQQHQQAAQPPEIEKPESLPSKNPDTRIYLWLSGEILCWKFIARGLGLTEADIETIQRDHQGVTEQKYQMFIVWERRYYQNCTYQTLGRVLQESEKNRRLYPEYVNRVKSIER